jgi:hypothetical protein
MSSTASQVAIAKANHTLPTLATATRALVSSDSFIAQFYKIWETEAVVRPTITQAAYMFDLADTSIRTALSDAQNANSANTDTQNANSADEALTTVANSWNRLGIGNEIPQSALIPRTSQTACS